MTTYTRFLTQVTPNLNSSTTHLSSNSSNAGASRPSTSNGPIAGGPATETSVAATDLASAIDDFLGDLEKKFRAVGDEIMVKRKLRFIVYHLPFERVVYLTFYFDRICSSFHLVHFVLCLPLSSEVRWQTLYISGFKLERPC